MPGFGDIINILKSANAISLALPLQQAGLCSLADISNSPDAMKKIILNVGLQNLLLDKPNISTELKTCIADNERPAHLCEYKRHRKDFPTIQYA